MSDLWKGLIVGFLAGAYSMGQLWEYAEWRRWRQRVLDKTKRESDNPARSNHCPPSTAGGPRHHADPALPNPHLPCRHDPFCSREVSHVWAWPDGQMFGLCAEHALCGHYPGGVVTAL